MKIDFNIEEENIEFSKPITEQELTKFKEHFSVDLPPSFVYFKKEIADFLYISSGNALEIFPLIIKGNGVFTVESITSNYAHLGNVLESHKLLIFGMSGVDSETWAFYLGKKYTSGEYPIIWLSPGEERFFLHSTNFESFLNIQYHSLTLIDEIDDYDEYYKKLVTKYDKEIEPFGYDTMYSAAHDLADLELIMSEL
jgi:hypothetical protein